MRVDEMEITMGYKHWKLWVQTIEVSPTNNKFYRIILPFHTYLSKLINWNWIKYIKQWNFELINKFSFFLIPQCIFRAHLNFWVRGFFLVLFFPTVSLFLREVILPFDFRYPSVFFLVLSVRSSQQFAFWVQERVSWAITFSHVLAFPQVLWFISVF